MYYYRTGKSSPVSLSEGEEIPEGAKIWNVFIQIGSWMSGFLGKVAAPTKKEAQKCAEIIYPNVNTVVDLVR